MGKFPKADTEELCVHCEREAIRVSLANLRTFPFVQQAVQERGMNLVGCYFDLEAGHLLEINERTGEVTTLD
jgi:carbonic anhydrase